METPICTACRTPKGVVACGGCKAPVCRKCAQVVEKDSFAFLEPVPQELQHKTYCGPCFFATVAPALDTYQQTMARARAVIVFLKKQGEATRLMRRAEKPIRVESCADKDETLMRLAFFAARAGFNAIIDVDIFPEKVRNAGYQTSRWRGSAVPTRLDEAKLARREPTRR